MKEKTTNEEMNQVLKEMIQGGSSITIAGQEEAIWKGLVCKQKMA